MKFTAQKIDLTLELTTLESEEVVLNPKMNVTAEEAMSIIKEWTVIEKESKDRSNVVQVIADQLAVVYPKLPEWFMKNFDPRTLSEIVQHVAGSLGGLRKNEVSSS